jgi:hypothetical protein
MMISIVQPTIACDATLATTVPLGVDADQCRDREFERSYTHGCDMQCN